MIIVCGISIIMNMLRIIIIINCISNDVNIMITGDVIRQGVVRERVF